MQITRSVTIIGQGATILFDQDAGGNPTPWPWTATGAIYVNFPRDGQAYPGQPSKFHDQIRRGTGLGQSVRYVDPENTGGINHAGIDTGDRIHLRSTQSLTLQNMSVFGPPAYDASSFQNLQNQASASGMVYVGEPAVGLVQDPDPVGLR